MTRTRWAVVIATSAAFAVAIGCASILNIQDIPPGADASDASIDTSTTSDAPSCAPSGAGKTNCGDSGAESCCTSLLVEGGTFFRTYTNDSITVTGTTDPAQVSSFRLDEYEVTVGRFRQFKAAWEAPQNWRPSPGAGKHTHLKGDAGLAGLANSGSAGGYENGWVSADNGQIKLDSQNLQCAYTPTWTDVPSSQDKLPMNCVNWWEAYAFCIWDGAFLPSEAEWEYAAAGGGGLRRYPWGPQPPGANNQYAIYGCYYPSGDGGDASCEASVSNIAPVGTPTLGAGAWGQLDLAGNLVEWNLDYDAVYTTPCTDCAYLDLVDGGNARVGRGANFSDPGPQYLLTTNRYSDGPDNRSYQVGFRCARAP